MRPHLCQFFILSIIILSACGEEKSITLPTAMQLEQAHERYKEPGFDKRRFVQKDMLPVLQKHADAFKFEILGNSVEGREIYQVNIGEGPVKVLLWSQMHGDESTATMALFDIFNFLKAEDSAFNEMRTLLKEQLSMKFIPMVNPDGAERFIRRNALGIDLNRDALRTASIEAKILKNAQTDFSPHFGFNLHDQSRYYNTQGNRHPATISVLAPAYNEEREINEVRLNAMKVIAGMNKLLQQIVPQHVGKYNDAFEPRAFGDNFQKWGTSTILIESGGFPEDPEKQYIRKLNFIAILGALSEIASGQYEKYSQDEYFSIPDNESRLFDLLIKNVKVESGDYTYTTDIGVRRNENNLGREHYVTGVVSDWGDLSTFFGYVELDAEGLSLSEGKLYEKRVDHEKLSISEAMELLKQGYMWVNATNKRKGELHHLPLMVVTPEESVDSEVNMGGKANFFLKKEGQLRYAVVNGYLVDLMEENPDILLQNRF